MKKTLVLLSLCVGLAHTANAMSPAKTSAGAARVASVQRLKALPAPAAQASVWKSQDEYNTYMAMHNEKDPQKKIALADAFLAKFTDSSPAVKGYVYTEMLAASQQAGDSAKAIDSAKKLLALDPNNLEGLRYLSFAFPYTFKPYDPNAKMICVEGNGHLEVVPTEQGTKYSDASNVKVLTPEDCATKWKAKAEAELSRAESDAKHGLDLLAKVPKPANMTDDQFQQAIKPVRAVFNGTVGFVELQNKNYASAITSLKAAAEDNPTDVYVSYRLGVAYLSSTPPDYNNGFWYVARAVSLSKSGSGSESAPIDDYLKGRYACYHGGEDGLDAIVTQAASSPTPPANLQITALQEPAATGNPNVDNFNNVTYLLKVQGCPSLPQQTFAQLKGQPLGLGGYVNSVDKGTDPDTYLVKIALDQGKADSGYDIVLQDSQPKVDSLKQGDALRFQGTIDSYTDTPAFSLTLINGNINQDDLDAATAKAKAKVKARPRRRG